MEEITFKRNFYYSSVGKTLIRTEKEYQHRIILKLLKKLKKLNFPITAKRIIVGKLPMWEGKCYAYAYNDNIFISTHKTRFPTSEQQTTNNKKKEKRVFGTLIHELIHVIDYNNSNKLTSLFFSLYNEALKIFKTHLEEDNYKKCEDLFSQPLNRKYLFKHGMRKWYWDTNLQRSIKKNYTDFVKKEMGLPSTYCLTAPQEFPAELIAFYCINKKTVNKKYHSIIETFLESVK